MVQAAALLMPQLAALERRGKETLVLLERTRVRPLTQEAVVVVVVLLEPLDRVEQVALEAQARPIRTPDRLSLTAAVVVEVLTPQVALAAQAVAAQV